MTDFRLNTGDLRGRRVASGLEVGISLGLIGKFNGIDIPSPEPVWGGTGGSWGGLGLFRSLQAGRR